MNAATFGAVIGMFLAAGGIAYIWIGLLWVIRVYKRWPRFTYWSGAVLAALIGLVTAIGNGEYITTLGACLAASVFVIWRGNASMRKSAEQPAA